MLDDFKKKEIYKKFYIEAANLNCKIKVNCGKSIDLKDKSIYLGIVFCDENDKTIELYDEGEMSASISIVRVDEKKWNIRCCKYVGWFGRSWIYRVESGCY